MAVLLFRGPISDASTRPRRPTSASVRHTRAPRRWWGFVLVGLAAAGLSTKPLLPGGVPNPRPADPAPAAASAIPGTWGQRPIDFIANEGQWDAEIRYAVLRGGLAAGITDSGLRLDLRGTELALRFGEARSSVGEDKRDATYNFVHGNDSTKWREGVAAYRAVTLRDVADGIDVHLRSSGADLAYDIAVDAGIDQSKLTITADGAESLAIEADGSLTMHTATGPLRQSAPLAWEQLSNGDRQYVTSSFRLLGDNRYGFTVDRVDSARPLVIDPGIEWSTYLGGSGDETLGGMAKVNDASGDVVIGGWTRSPEFPATGALRQYGSVFVARMSSTGSNLVYATYFGGSHVHTVYDVAVDAGGNPLVVGDTNSKDFPITAGAVDSTPPGTASSPLDYGDYDGYAIRFNATGGGPIMGTYLSGNPVSGMEIASRAAYDPAGNLVIAGTANSATFPTTVGAYDRTIAGNDVFVVKLNPTGTQLMYSTFLGGDGLDDVFEVVVGADGIINLAGQTIVNTPTGLFPTTAGAADTTAGTSGDREGFFVRLAPNGGGAADLRYSTMLGGNQYVDAANGLTLHPSNPASITLSGFTRSGDFPTTVGAYLRVHPVPVDGSMGWVARFTAPAGGANGATLNWSTLYGTAGNQTANDVVVDAAGAAIIVGGTAVDDPPTTPGAFDRIPAEGSGNGNISDGYVAKLSADGSQLLFSSLVGARGSEAVLEVVHAGGNSIIVAGISDSTDFPTSAGAFDRIYAADGKRSGNDAPGTNAEDIFVSRVSLDPVVSADGTAPPAPSIVWPIEGSVFRMTESTGVRVAFDWTDVADPSGIAAYHVQVSPNAQFRHDLQAEFDDWFEPFSPTSFDSYFYCCSSSADRTYSMRVQTMDRAGNIGPWSPVRTYRLLGSSSTTTTLTAPVLTSPPNNGRYRPGSITFAWDHVAGAVGYTIEVDTSTAYNTANRQVQSNLAVNRATFTLSGDRNWVWRVRATNATTVGPNSANRALQTRAGSPAPPTPTAGTTIPTPPPTGSGLASVMMSPEVAWGAVPLTGTVTLHTPAPTGGAVVTLHSQYPDRVIVPTSVTVPAGATTATFSGSTVDGPHQVSTTVMGTYAGSSHAWYVLADSSEPALVLQTLTLTSTTVQGGGVVTGTVAFFPGWFAGPGGAIVHLGTTNPAVTSVPTSVVIPQGASSTTFPITTSSVAASTQVTIIATRSSMKSAILDVLPAGGLATLTASPNPAIGTGGSTGTVTLGGPAPAGGKVVTLTSSDIRWATVPASVTVPAGATSATFAIATASDPTQGQFSLLTATADGVQRFVSLNVNPPAGGGGGSGLAAPSLLSPANDARFNAGQTIAFDWSNVTGAAGYVLEIDDSSSFTAPLTRSVSITTSAASVSGLPTQRLYWRARAVSSSGTAGTNSSSRRIEIR